jgi:hypothetical protein
MNRAAAFRALDKIHAKTPITLMIDRPLVWDPACQAINALCRTHICILSVRAAGSQTGVDQASPVRRPDDFKISQV